MAEYYTTAYDVPTGAVVDTWNTLLAIIAANTAGHRAELRELIVGFGGEAARDIQVSLRLNRTNNAGAGTGTSVTPAQKDPNMRATDITSKKAYSVEPTTYPAQPLWEGAVNSRGSLVVSWPKGEGIKMLKNTTLGLLATPGEAQAVAMVVTMGFDQF